MNRLNALIVAGLVVVLALVGLTTAAAAARPGPALEDGTQQAFSVRLFMSDREDGDAMRSFVSDTNRVYAVVAYENASSQRYRVRLRDLAGIEVFNDGVVLSGSGRQAKEISITDFVASYRRHTLEKSTALSEAAAELEFLCQGPPAPPVPTEPPVNPTPGPSPTPAGWDRWRARMMDALESSTTTAAELRRTLQATGSLPDVAELEGASDQIASAQQSLVLVGQKLEQALRKVNPPAWPGPGTPTPEPAPVPDPEGACALVADAAQDTEAALASSQAIMDGLPEEDMAAWRLPPTSARYDGGQFSSCVQYSTDLVHETGIASSTPWTIGDPGLPALIFPSPDLVDRISLGQLRLRLPSGATAIYAQTVDVPGVNRNAEIGAFVTDAMCNPVDGVTMTLTVDSAAAGAVEPAVADVRAGVATALLTSGTTPTLNSAVTGIVCVGPCGSVTSPAAPPITARTRFSVIGPPRTLTFHVNPSTINVEKGQRANISVEAKDYFNRSVADGTRLRLSIAPGDPGVLARSVTPRGSREAELQLLGKEVDLVTISAFTIVPPGDDPGLIYGTDLFLVGGTDGLGPVELRAVWNGVEAKPVVVTLVSRQLVFLPVVMKAFDVLATPRYSTTPVAPAVQAVVTSVP